MSDTPDGGPIASHLLSPGDPAPWFVAPAVEGAGSYAFDAAGGRHVVLLFLGNGQLQIGREAEAILARHRALFDDIHAAFFGVTVTPEDETTGFARQQLPGIRWFKDWGGDISRLYGALFGTEGRQQYAPHWLLLDPRLIVVGRYALADGDRMAADLARLVAVPQSYGDAPVLMVPRVLERDLCQTLIALFDHDPGRPSGFMHEVDGLTVEKHNDRFKRRRDVIIQDHALIDALNRQLGARLRPAISRAFQFDATRIERWLIARYDGEDRGFFAPHRDNTTRGAKHRRFACTINLNAEDYEGGELVFPEFGGRTYRPPTGAAMIFSCSLMHGVLPVTRGQRFAFLPFFYDEAAAKVRKQNKEFIAPMTLD